MGKKGKGKGGKPRKKKGTSEPVMSFRQAFLAYQKIENSISNRVFEKEMLPYLLHRITLKEQELEEALYENRGMADRVTRNEFKLEHLKEEQAALFHNLLRESRDMDSRLLDETQTEQTQVTDALFGMWRSGKDEETLLKEFRHRVRELDKAIIAVEADVKFWENYRDVVASEKTETIDSLTTELNTINDSYDAMCRFLETDLDRTKTRIAKEKAQTVVNAKERASEKAIVTMGKYDKIEVIDNDYLKVEVDSHKKEYLDLLAEVETMEGANLEIMAELFECKKEDLRFSGSILSEQFLDPTGFLDHSESLAIDLERAALVTPAPPPSRPGAAARPKSAIHKAVLQRISDIDLNGEQELSGGSDDEDSFDDLEPDTFEGTQAINDFKNPGAAHYNSLSIGGKHARLNTPTAEMRDARKKMEPVSKDLHRAKVLKAGSASVRLSERFSSAASRVSITSTASSLKSATSSLDRSPEPPAFLAPAARNSAKSTSIHSSRNHSAVSAAPSLLSQKEEDEPGGSVDEEESGFGDFEREETDWPVTFESLRAIKEGQPV